MENQCVCVCVCGCVCLGDFVHFYLLVFFSLSLSPSQNVQKLRVSQLPGTSYPRDPGSSEGRRST